MKMRIDLLHPIFSIIIETASYDYKDKNRLGHTFSNVLSPYPLFNSHDSSLRVSTHPSLP